MYRTSSSVIRKIKKAFENDPSVSVSALAEKLGLSTSTVYRYKASPGKSTAVVADLDEIGGEDCLVSDSIPSMSVSLRLSDLTGPAEVKVRNGDGNLLGTLWITKKGLAYKRPNQKLIPERVLSWENIDKLMQLGLL